MAQTILGKWISEILGREYRPLTMSDVEFFGFGEAGYYVELHNGAAHFDNDLDRLLDVMQRLWYATSQCGYLMSYEDSQRRPGGPTIGRRKNTILMVKPTHSAVAMNEHELAEMTDRIRQAVTIFNLTGEWDRPFKANL